MNELHNMKEMSDESLLAEFAATKDEAIFAELVRRYSKLVFSICNQILGNIQDAEDAAQAVFLILAQKAASLRSIASLDGWLHRVAWRVAMDARKMAQRRNKREEMAAMMKEQRLAEPMQPHNQTEQWQQLHLEIDALPSTYRLPLVMHYFQARSREEIAKLLKANESTVSMRITRGREMLKNRLAKSGAALSIGLLAALSSTSASAVEVPAAFVGTTAKVASLFAKGNTAGIAASSNALSLAQAALKALFWTKLKIAALALAAIGVSAAMVFEQAASSSATLEPQTRGKNMVVKDSGAIHENPPPPTADKKKAAAEVKPKEISAGSWNLMTIVSCQYHEKPLREIVTALGEKLNLIITLSESADEKVGDKIVTLESKPITGAEALMLLAKNAGLETKVENGGMVLALPEEKNPPVPPKPAEDGF